MAKRKRKLPRITGETKQHRASNASAFEAKAFDDMMSAFRSLSRKVERYELARKQSDRLDKAARKDWAERFALDNGLDLAEVRAAGAAAMGFDEKTGAEVLADMKADE